MAEKKIAVIYKGSEVSHSLSNCEGIRIFEVEGEDIKNSYDIKNESSDRNKLAEIISIEKVDVLIAGVISSHSRSSLYHNNIYYLADAGGDVAEAAMEYLKYDDCSMDDLFGEGYEDCHSCGSKKGNGECDGSCGC